MTTSTPQLMPASLALRRIVLIVLIVAALALRIYGINAPPTEFHPMRQFRAAIIARDMYYKAVPSAATDQFREVAASSAAKEELLEPRIIETVAATLYAVAGSEQLWLPRLFSALCWLVGGYLLYRLAAKLISEDAGLIAAAFYLLNPFTVLASRVIQPDPMMMMAMLAALDAMIWYDDAPSWKRLVIAGLFAAVGPLIKPICIFGIGLAFAGLSLNGRRGWRGLINAQVIAFGAIMALPMLIYYLVANLGRVDIQREATLDILPSLLFQRTYWGGWFTQIGKAVGPLTFLAGLIGFALMKPDRTKFMLTGLWAGYLVMGLIFTYTVSTHDYYQFQLIAIIALCLTPIVLPILERVRALFTKDITRMAFVSLLLVILAQFSAYENFWRTTFRYYYQNIDPAIAKLGPEIGDAVGHSTSVLILADSDARPLIYYARVAGLPWPYGPNGEAGIASGIKTPDAAAQMAIFEETDHAQYFIITDFRELNEQPGLKELLKKYPVVAESPYYLIYDISQPVP